MGDVTINYWRTLTYHDPARVLRELRAVEHGMADVLRKLHKYGAQTRTVLAVRLNREGHVILDREWPRIPFAQLWFFWASAPGAAEWSIYGDALGKPGQWAFDYPT